ncbi:hypothetical protein ACS5PN_24200 [Roseateles sp. NT4]|uniref:hypothetical protein n=1 Tax=Roseateles sp. NT4 TaxID=3453715 RepID=UPI003EEEAF55
MKRRQVCASALFGLLPWPARADALRLPSGEVVLKLDGDFPADTRREIDVWVTRSVAALVGYFGRQPQPRIELRLRAAPGEGVSGGWTDVDPAPFVGMRVGRQTSAARFLDDWVLVHELVHLSVPNLPRAHNWLHEGLATYVETVARARAGITPFTQLWGELARGMPQGQPARGDAGLDGTRSWGRLYWGGAIFCLQADVRMLRASGGRSGLRQALQGVQAAGGHYGQDWSVTRLLAVADAAVGQTVLSDLYRDAKDTAMAVDLDALWRELGVVVRGDNVSFDDTAPGAAMRRAIEGR